MRHNICVPNSCPNISKELYVAGIDDPILKNELAACYREKYEDLGLTGNVTTLICETQEPFHKIDNVDMTVGLLMAFFISFITLSSIYDSFARDYGEEKYQELMGSKMGKIMLCFSIPNNYKRLTTIAENEAADRFTNIQGMRFYTTMCVILGHVCMINFAIPVSNPKFNEDSTTTTANMIIANGGFCVQSFFGISGLLTSYFFFKSFDGKKNVSMKHVVMAFINRYMRLTPGLLFMIAFDATWLRHISRGPYWDKVIGYEYRNCRKNWWTNLLYLNNYIDRENMCFQQSWYLAADTQVFLVAIFVTYLMLKHRKHAYKIGFTALGIGILIPCAVNYYHNFEITTKHYPEVLYNVLLDVPQWHIMFASGYNNMGAYMTGVLCGYFYYNNRSKNLLPNKFYVGAWWVFLWGLPLTVIFMVAIFYQDDFQAARFWSSLYVGFARPLFALGILAAVLGISQGHGWVMKRVLETKFVQICGRISYCTFLVHVSVQRVRVGETRLPAYASENQFFFQLLGDTCVSYIAALMLCLCVEMPISALQKIYIPDGKSKASAEIVKGPVAVNGTSVTQNGSSNKENGATKKLL